MFDRISAALRHLLLLLAPGLLIAALAFLKAITDAGGVLGDVDWSAALAAAVLGVAGWLALYLTPLTRQYGVGSRPSGDDGGHTHVQVPIAVALGLAVIALVLIPTMARANNLADSPGADGRTWLGFVTGSA